MYLKRLELMGFKSFANRTELEFVPGVTAVVGPNGSGKSNISDSIRWVLGEQSAKSLRGSKMEDIIFAGSDTRKPVNFCEVALTLDNSDRTLKLDYSEVTISRRVYRSGESEYYINRQSCRLRDIIELFMDTGLGKEAYSIIGQGRIEEILSTKSEDRRGIFEEAAGIVKYKARKREAEKKLEETEANLVRIDDILSEISDQIEPLKHQAEKAKKYVQLADSLKHTEVSLYLHQIGETNQNWQDAKKQIVSLNEAHTLLASELNQVEAGLASWRWKLAEQDKEIENLQVQLLEVSEEAEKTEGKREVLRERNKNVNQNYSLTLEKRDQLEKRISDLTHQHELEESRLHVLQDEAAETKEQLLHYEGLLGEVAKGLATDIEQLKNDYIELLNHMASLKNEIRHTSNTFEASGQKKSRLLNQQQDVSRSIQEVQQKKKSAEDELGTLSERIDKCLESFKELNIKGKELQQVREQRAVSVRKLEQRADSLHSKKEILQEMQNSYTGFTQGVKEILKAREKGISGIHGAVAELINVSSELETAIEVALGGAMQNVVVENEVAGRKAIQWLKEHKGGRATFLPLDVIRGRKLSPQDEMILKGLGGFIGVASDLVTTEQKYRDIVGSLLGNVVVTRSLENANEAARKTGYRYRFVTLEGDIVNPGGSMTGGSVQQKNTNLLGRSRQLEELDIELAKTLDEIKQAKHDAKGIEQELKTIIDEQDRLRTLGEELRLKEEKAKGVVNQYVMEYQNLSDRKQAIDQEIKFNGEEQAGFSNRLQSIEEQLKQEAEKEKRLKAHITMIENEKNVLQTSKEEYVTQMTDLKVRAAELRKQHEAVLSIMKRVEEEKANHQKEWDAAQEYLRTLQETMQGSVDTVEELERKITDLRQKKDETGKEIQSLKIKRSTLVEEMDKLEGESKLLRRRVKELEDKIHKEELKADRCEVELDNLLLKLSEEYSYSYEVAKEIYQLPEDPKKTEAMVIGFKKEIQELGHINLDSIEEYDRQSERFEFLTVQSHDLGEAKQTLYRVIREIDEEMSKRFLETFEQIREQFQQVFTHLFVGGRADLVLSNPDNPLITGVDIVAQPPGKKLQNLALLSGGEKALTAIALLFAILKIKPVPFCVLDEVEAALDDANVYRFADYLRAFSGQTQFICVTHRKGTMEGADVLYGVTMEEQGVSKLVSVKLEDRSFVSETA